MIRSTGQQSKKIPEPPYLLRYAKFKEQLGDKTGASELRSQAEKLIREEMANGPYGHHNELAQLLLDRRDPKELPEAIEEAKKDAEARGTSESYYLLSQSLYQAGFLKEAKHTIAKALEIGVNSCEYQKLDSKINSKMVGLKFAGHFSQECLKDSVNKLLNSVGML